MTSLLDVLGCDPGGEEEQYVESAALRGHLEDVILKKKPQVISLSCGVHLELVDLVDAGRLTTKDCGCLHVVWVTGR